MNKTDSLGMIACLIMVVSLAALLYLIFDKPESEDLHIKHCRNSRYIRIYTCEGQQPITTTPQTKKICAAPRLRFSVANDSELVIVNLQVIPGRYMLDDGWETRIIDIKDGAGPYIERFGCEEEGE